MTHASTVRSDEPHRPRLLVRGNRKLGEGIYSFSLPAGATCPGQTPSCARHCYAQQGHFTFSSVRQLYARNLELSRRDDFAGRMAAEVRRRCAGVVRVHTSGDFYGAEYAAKWVQIASVCRDTRFFTFTRSWRVPEVRPEVDRLARLRNFRLWYSCDRDSGVPATKPKRVRLAWMQTAADDVPPRADLVFRIRPLRQTVVKRIGLALVCPVENGATTATDCGRCRLCFSPSGR